MSTVSQTEGTQDRILIQTPIPLHPVLASFPLAETLSLDLLHLPTSYLPLLLFAPT